MKVVGFSRRVAWEGSFTMNTRSAWGGSKGAFSQDGRSYDRFRDLGEYLSLEERKALRELGQGSTIEGKASQLALRLVSLGLAELSSGRLVHSSDGRRVFESIPAPRTPPQARVTCAEAEIERGLAVSPRQALTDRTIVCLECGRAYKALKRHLALAHGMTPGAYRTRWNLPRSYPMVAPLLSRKRRFLAKQLGLGHAARRNTPNRRSKLSMPES